MSQAELFDAISCLWTGRRAVPAPLQLVAIDSCPVLQGIW